MTDGATATGQETTTTALRPFPVMGRGNPGFGVMIQDSFGVVVTVGLMTAMEPGYIAARQTFLRLYKAICTEAKEY